MEWKYLKYELAQKWEQSQLRQWINGNPFVVYGIAGFCVLVFAVMVIGRFLPEKTQILEKPPKQEWYYDLNTGKLFSADVDQTPPIEAPSGPLPGGGNAGVRAHVFVRTTEAGEGKEFIGFLETSNPNDTETSKDSWAYRKLVKHPEDEQWYMASSRKGRELVQPYLMPSGDSQYFAASYPE